MISIYTMCLIDESVVYLVFFLTAWTYGSQSPKPSVYSTGPTGSLAEAAGI